MTSNAVKLEATQYTPTVQKFREGTFYTEEEHWYMAFQFSVS